MKKILFILMLLPLFASCDQVDEKDRYIEVGDIEVSRKVLLAEFTGQRCVNCPAAHRILEVLSEQYGDDLVEVSIHAGSFANPSPYGLMQEEGDEYAQRWGITAYPQGVVDYTGGALNMDMWASAVREEIGKETDLEINLAATLSDDEKQIKVTTKLFSSENLEGKLQLWVVENGIIALQYDGNTTINNYVHNNVFRGCVNGLWGQDVSLTARQSREIENSVEVVSGQQFDFANWHTDNLYIVGFVYNDSGVVQVERVKVD